MQVAWLLLAAALVADHAVDEADSDLAARVESLVRQLDAPTRRQRIEAEQELLNIGPAALPHLPPPELLSGASARESVRRTRILLEQRQARESIDPSRITLAGRYSLGEIAAEFTRQTGNAVTLRDLPPEHADAVFGVEYDRTPFWSAVDDLSRRAALQRLPEAAEGLVLVPRRRDDAPPVAVTYDGAFRVELKSAEIRPLFGRDDERLLRFRLEIAAEPRLRPLFAAFAAKDMTATAGQAETLAPLSPDARYELPLAEGGAPVGFHLDFRIPKRNGVETTSLFGTMSILTAAGSEEIRFARLDDVRNSSRRRGGVTVRIRDVQEERAAEAGRSLTVRTVVAYDTGGPAFESHRTWIFHNQAWLVTPQGTRIEPHDATTTRQADGTAGVDYEFTDVAPPLDKLTFVYVAPTLLIDVPVKFSFDGVALETKTPPDPEEGETRRPD